MHYGEGRSYVGIANLIRIEFYKLFRPRFVITIVLISILAVVGFAFFLKNAENYTSGATDEELVLREEMINTDDWRKSYQIQMQLNMMLIDVYGEDTVNANNKILQYRIDNDIEPDKRGNNTWDFTQYVFNTLGFVFVLLSIYTSANIVAQEYTYKTEKVLYSKPFKRSSILLAKYMVSLIFCAMIIFFAFVLSWITGGIVFSFSGGDKINLFYYNGNVIVLTVIARSMLEMGFTSVSIIVCGSLSFFLTSLLHSKLMSVGIVSVCFFLGKTVSVALYNAKMYWCKYLFFAYLKPSALLNAAMPEEFSASLCISILLVTYLVLFVGSLYALEKKDIR